MQTPKQILAEIKMKNAIKKAEQAREEETNNFKQRGFNSKEEYADFLDKRDRIQASQSGAISAKKAAIAGVVAAAGIGAGLYAMNNMGGNESSQPTQPDYYNPPINPSQPVNPDINPDDFEEIVNNPTYQEQANKILEDAQNAIKEAENQMSEELNQVYDQIDSISNSNGITDQNVFGVNLQEINGVSRFQDESVLSFLIRGKDTYQETLEQDQEAYIEDLLNYPQINQFFEENGVELDYDTWYDLNHIDSGVYYEEDYPLLFKYLEFQQQNVNLINEINNIDSAKKIISDESVINMFDSYIDKAYDLLSDEDKVAIDRLSEQLYSSNDNMSSQITNIWNDYVQDLSELQNSYLQNEYDLSTFAGLPEVQADELGLSDNLNEFAEIKTNILTQKANLAENIDANTLGDAAVNKSMLSDIDLSSSMDTVQDSVLGSDLAPYLVAGAVVAGAAVVAGSKLHKKSKARKVKTEKAEEQTL